VQSWRGPQALSQIAAKGYRGLLSYGYYLNYLQPAAKHYAVDPGDAGLILGGEACMWSEYVDEYTVDSRVWPRMVAIAERFWSPKDVTDVDSMYRRMESVSRWLEWTGIRHRAHTETALERMAGDHPTQPLEVLAAAVEAGGHDLRAQTGRYTTLTPLNRFVDAVPPESESIRRLEQAAARLAPQDVALLRACFEQWAANDARFRPMLDANPFVAELAPLSENLKSLGVAGLRALQYVDSKSPPDPGWLAAQERLLETASKPIAEVQLAAVRPLRRLLQAVQNTDVR
jgi:hexosaminidase